MELGARERPDAAHDEAAPLTRDAFVARLREEGARATTTTIRSTRDARGHADRGRAPALGAEPLLLPDAHPDQGRADPRRSRRTPPSGACGSGASTTTTAEEGEGGLALWLRLAEAVGLDREEVASCRAVLPGVRFACDGYVELVRERSLVEAVASSLTEFFAPDLMARRIAAWERHYPWVSADELGYFRARVPRARRDSRRRSPSWCATRRRASCRSAASRRWCARPRSCGTCSTASTPPTSSPPGAGGTRA